MQYGILSDTLVSSLVFFVKETYCLLFSIHFHTKLLFSCRLLTFTYNTLYNSMILHTEIPTSEEKAKLEHILYATLSSSPATSSAEMTWLPITFSLFVFMVGSQFELAVKSMFSVRQGSAFVARWLLKPSYVTCPLHNLIMKLTGGGSSVLLSNPVLMATSCSSGCSHFTECYVKINGY